MTDSQRRQGGRLTWGHLFVNNYIKFRTSKERTESDMARSDQRILKQSKQPTNLKEKEV